MFKNKRKAHWLGIVDDFRTWKWLEGVKYPELVYAESLQFN